MTEPLTDRQSSDAIHRADFPRMAVRGQCGEDACADLTTAATAVADYVCGVRRVEPGPDPHRGTLEWWKAYIAECDRRADAMAPAWRLVDRHCGPMAWAVEQFGGVHPDGDLPEMPRDMHEHAAWVDSGLTTREWRELS